MPEDVELKSADAVKKWVDDIGYADKVVVVEGEDDVSYADALIALGAEDMFSLKFTEDELVECGFKRLHGRRLVEAAQVLSHSLGTAVGIGRSGQSGRRLDFDSAAPRRVP